MFKFDFDVEPDAASPANRPASTAARQTTTDATTVNAETVHHASGAHSSLAEETILATPATPNACVENFCEIRSEDVTVVQHDTGHGDKPQQPPIRQTAGVQHLAAPVASGGGDEDRGDGDVYERAERSHSDLIPQVYEGGYKVWECTLDLLNVLDDRPELVRGTTLLDLGCGAGLAGLKAAQQGATEVHFHDYNASVLRKLTVHNSRLLKTTCPMRFFAGDWTLFQCPVKYDIILTSETIYRPENYGPLCDLFDRCLVQPNGKVVVAAKAVYYGVGGTMVDFLEFCARRGWKTGRPLRQETSGVRREVVLLTKSTSED